MQTVNIDDIHSLLAVMPPHIASDLKQEIGNGDLLEIVMDLGRLPEARFPNREILLGDHEVTEADIQHVTSLIGTFSGDEPVAIT